MSSKLAFSPYMHGPASSFQSSKEPRHSHFFLFIRTIRTITPSHHCHNTNPQLVFGTKKQNSTVSFRLSLLPNLSLFRHPMHLPTAPRRLCVTDSHPHRHHHHSSAALLIQHCLARRTQGTALPSHTCSRPVPRPKLPTFRVPPSSHPPPPHPTRRSWPISSTNFIRIKLRRCAGTNNFCPRISVIAVLLLWPFEIQ